MSVYNTLPASVYIIDRIFPGGRPPVTLLQLVSASVTLVTASVLVVTQVGLDFSDSAYFWLVVGVICSVTYTLHCRFVIHQCFCSMIKSEILKSSLQDR